jgi:hypothetical protein
MFNASRATLAMVRELLSAYPRGINEEGDHNMNEALHSGFQSFQVPSRPTPLPLSFSAWQSWQSNVSVNACPVGTRPLASLGSRFRLAILLTNKGLDVVTSISSTGAALLLLLAQDEGPSNHHGGYTISRHVAVPRLDTVRGSSCAFLLPGWIT